MIPKELLTVNCIYKTQQGVQCSSKKVRKLDKWKTRSNRPKNLTADKYLEVIS